MSIIKQLPTAKDWKEAYAADVDTYYVIARIRDNQNPWKEKVVRKVHKNYWDPLRNNSNIFKHDRLSMCKLIRVKTVNICCISRVGGRCTHGEV